MLLMAMDCNVQQWMALMVVQKLPEKEEALLWKAGPLLQLKTPSKLLTSQAFRHAKSY
jgi:hypothetical protein